MTELKAFSERVGFWCGKTFAIPTRFESTNMILVCLSFRPSIHLILLVCLMVLRRCWRVVDIRHWVCALRLGSLATSLVDIVVHQLDISMPLFSLKKP